MRFHYTLYEYAFILQRKNILIYTLFFKAGTANPTVQLYVLDVRNASKPLKKEVHPPPALEGQ